jgi:thioredoxin 2
MSHLQLDDRGVLTPCPSCRKTNRLRYSALGKTTKCGECGASLQAPSSPIETPSVAAFDTLIRASALPIVVDFWAPWCAPCRAVAPELEKVARSAAGDYVVIKVNTEALPELGQRFGVRSIPTMAVFEGGREITRTSGARPAADIDTFVRAAVHSHA